MFDKKIYKSMFFPIVLVLLFCVLFMILVSYSNAKYKSSFNQNISLSSGDLRDNIIAYPYACQTPPEGQTHKFPGEVDVQSGDYCIVNMDNYQLDFYHNSEEDRPYFTFGPVKEWYECDNAWRPYPADGDPKYPGLEKRWVDNINYTFDQYSRRWFYSPQEVKLDSENKEWVIPDDVKEIVPGQKFIIENPNTCYFIAYYSSHWCADELGFKPQQGGMPSVRTIEGAEEGGDPDFVFWPRFNTVNDQTKTKDPVTLSVVGGQQKLQGGNGQDIFVSAIIDSGDKWGSVDINKWLYRYKIKFVEGEDPLSPGAGGAKIQIKKQSGISIRRIGIVAKCPECEKNKDALLKINPSGDKEKSYGIKNIVEPEDIYLYIFDYRTPELFPDDFCLKYDESIDIFINGQGARGAEIYGIYVDWCSNEEISADPYVMPMWGDVPNRDGLDVSPIVEEEISNVDMSDSHSTNNEIVLRNNSLNVADEKIVANIFDGNNFFDLYKYHLAGILNERFYMEKAIRENNWSNKNVKKIFNTNSS